MKPPLLRKLLLVVFSVIVASCSKPPPAPLSEDEARSLLSHVRQVHLATQTAALDNYTRGTKEWPTQTVQTKREFRDLLVKGNYLSAKEADELLKRLVIGKVTESDSADTILAASDTFPAIRSGKLKEGYCVVFHKGGSGGIYEASLLERNMEHMKMPSEFLKD